MTEDRLSRRMETVRSIPLFTDIAERDLAAIIADFRLREYSRDELIFRQGDETTEIYVVLRGKVRIFKISPGGEETTIAIFGANDVIGEMAALDNQARSATGKALTATALLAMTQERFVYHAQTVPKLGFALARLLSLKLRWTAAYAESIAQYDAGGRLLHVILLQNERYGQVIEPGRRYVLDLGLTQSDLASMVGARREWVNRLLRDWTKRGLLEFDRGAITILDLARVVEERDSRIEANLGEEEW